MARRPYCPEGAVRTMAAFDELDFTRFDFDAVVVGLGIAVVETAHRESCLASLRRQGYGIDSLDFRDGIESAAPQINELFRWEEQFGYEFTAEDGLNLDALRDGFEFELQPGEGRVLELRGAEEAFHEDSYWLLSLLAIAHEYSTWQLAIGARFFVLLFLDPGSSLIGQQYRSLGVPSYPYAIHPRAEDPFAGSTKVPPGTVLPYVKLPVAPSWDSSMAAPVVFPIGDRPEIPADDAVELAELLNHKGMERQFDTAGDSLTAVVLAAKIREQAGIFPSGEPITGDWETSGEFELDEHELLVLSEVLEAEPWPRSRPWFEQFQYEVNRQIGSAD
jgi:hypothetical protein